ncbi:hypothetical protein F4778DRAFT_727772 [Xylariomycetidae sp. FL2044]|nr:hypothetical protein F4778DRAFT_727772 [Xylariomycetidae sp. FL2044]
MTTSFGCSNSLAISLSFSLVSGVMWSLDSSSYRVGSSEKLVGDLVHARTQSITRCWWTVSFDSISFPSCLMACDQKGKLAALGTMVTMGGDIFKQSSDCEKDDE